MRISLAIWSALVIAFLWIPLVIIGLYAFNKSNIQGWPISSWTFSLVQRRPGTTPKCAMRSWLSVKVGLVDDRDRARARDDGRVPLLRASVSSAATRSRSCWCCRSRCPGSSPGWLLRFFDFANIQSRSGRSSIGHATFCVVVVYNNVVARLRRTSPSLIEASQDLGADGWQTFRFVLWPVLSTALVAGGLLAFALSFDEVIVTDFTAGAQETLPIFILDNIERGDQLPVDQRRRFLRDRGHRDPGDRRAARDERHGDHRTRRGTGDRSGRGGGDTRALKHRQVAIKID